MTTEVSKFSVYDPRVIQTKPKYAVEKGALSITNVSFNAQTANQSAQQFNVIVPSENVFIDRAVDWISGGVLSIAVSLSAGGATALTSGTGTTGTVLMTGGEVAPAAFPSHQCVQQMTATINDATVTVNTADVLNQVLRLQDLASHRKQRTCPTMLDKYGLEQGVGYGASTGVYENSPLGGYSYAYETDAVPNGAFSQWWFCNLDGSVGNSTSTNCVVNALGLPVAMSTSTTQTVYIRWQSTEKLLLPPFIFGDSYELSTGLFGVQNFQVQMNMSPTPSRAIRIAQQYIGRAVGTSTSVYVTAVGVPAWVTTSGIGAYAPYPFQPTLSVQFLTPALDVPLPPKSVVPYMEFPRYITTGLAASQASTLGTAPNARGVTPSSTVLTSNTITLPNIPDLLMIYLKPSVADATLFGSTPYTNNVGTTTNTATGGLTWNSTIADFTLPIEAISINFDNFSGLLANHTQYQLYKMSVANGLDMDFSQWSGEARDSASAAGSTAAVSSTGSPYVSLVGGPLVLRPGRDFALQAGQAPGLVGNFTLQFSVTVGNQFAAALSTTGVNLYVVPISSGFFETIKGSSRIIKGVLTEQDILGAPAQGEDYHSALESQKVDRRVGAGKSRSRLGAYMS